MPQKGKDHLNQPINSSIFKCEVAVTFRGGFLAQLPCQITRVWLYISSSRHPCSHWQSFTSGELLYCTILQPTMEKERKLKNQYSPKGCNIFTCSLFLQVLLRSSVPLPASAKKHSSIAIYPSWPRSQRLSWLSQLAGLPLMWSSQFLFLRPFEWTRSINSNKKPWKILPSPKKGNPYFMGKKAYRNWKLMQKKTWKFCLDSQLDSIFSGFLHDSPVFGKNFAEEFPVHFFEGQVRR